MYKEYFGFRELPFVNSVDPKVFYVNPVYQEALATLEHGFRARKGIIVVTGEAGTGKTILVRKFLSNMASSVRPIHVVKTAYSFADTLRATLIESGVLKQNTNNVGNLEAFQGYLTQCSQADAVACLIVDDAQSFDGETIECLRQLLKLGENSAKPLQLILLGQPSFMNKLDQPALSQLKQRIALHCRLVPLTKSEVRRYIEFHISSAGYDGIGLFEPAALARIASYSAGIPRLVNNICDSALLAAYRSGGKQVTADMIDKIAQDLLLVSQERANPVAVNDNKENLTKPSPSAQVSTVWSNFQFADRAARPAVTSPTGRKLAKKISIIAIGVFILVAAGAVIYTGEAKRYFEDSKTRANSDDPRFGHIKPSAAGETEGLLTEGKTAIDSMRLAALDGAQTKSEAASKRENRDAREVAQPTPTFQEDSHGKASKEAPSVLDDSPAVNAKAHRRLLEIEIEKAINNRAIEGVSVNVVEGTAILAGQVASERQKAMAERAALGVQEVASVKNQIKIQP